MNDLPIDPEALVRSVQPIDLAIALVIVVAAWILSRLARRAARKLADQFEGLPPGYANTISRIAGYVVLFLGIGIALSFLGAHLQPLIATVILVSVVLALALRGIAENFAAGIILQTRRPIKMGDEIEAMGFTGVVRDINSRTVMLETFDGKLVHIPNSQVLANPVVNDTSHGMRRRRIEVRVGSTDIDAVVDALLAATANADGVLSHPEPKVHVTAIDPQRITTLVQFWHAPMQHRPVTSAVIREIAATGMSPLSVVSPVPDTPLTPPADI